MVRKRGSRKRGGRRSLYSKPKGKLSRALKREWRGFLYRKSSSF